MSHGSMDVASITLAPAGCTLTPAALDTRARDALRDMSAVLGASRHLQGHALQLKYRVGDRQLELIGEIGAPRQMSLLLAEGATCTAHGNTDVLALAADRDKLVTEAQRAPARIHRIAQAVAAAVSRGELLPEFREPGDRELWQMMCANNGADVSLMLDGEQLELSVPRLPKRYIDVVEHGISGTVKSVGRNWFILECIRDIGPPPAASRMAGKRQFQIDVSLEQVHGGILLLAVVAMSAMVRMELRTRAALDIRTGKVISYDLVAVVNDEVLSELAQRRIEGLQA
jgi:hypothetical protein